MKYKGVTIYQGLGYYAIQEGYETFGRYKTISAVKAAITRLLKGN